MSFIAPLIIPVASVVAFWSLFFDSRGVLNQITGYFGSEAVDWLNSDKAIYCVVLLYIWKNAGYSMVMFLAGLQNIPAQYYEAAEIEGPMHGTGSGISRQSTFLQRHFHSNYFDNKQFQDIP